MRRGWPGDGDDHRASVLTVLSNPLLALFNHSSPLRDVLTIVAGVGTGILSAMFGVGGAIVSTPAIRVLGASAALAVASTLPSVIPSALTGTVRYTKAHLINWRAVLTMDALTALALLIVFAVRGGRATVNACGFIGLLELVAGLAFGWPLEIAAGVITLAAWAYGRSG